MPHSTDINVAILAPEARPESLPDPAVALREPEGLLAIGGRLSVEFLHHAYRQATFPWFSVGQPILWWSPRERAVFDSAHFKQRRSIVRYAKNYGFTIRINTCFNEVITGCREHHKRQGVWITTEMLQAFIELHHHGLAHSVEVFAKNRLVGGLYGVLINRVFFAESMFSAHSGASKYALLHLADHWQPSLSLIDAQFMNPHLESLGAYLISRESVLAHLKPA